MNNMKIRWKPIIIINTFIFCFLWACDQASNKDKNHQEIMKTGAGLFSKYACATCHSLDGREVYGPPLNDLYMKEVEVIRQGQVMTLKANRDYLKRAISDPRYEEVYGYQSKDMPEVHISMEEVELLVDYLIALDKGNNSQDRSGAAGQEAPE
jgi:cytochrome c oxidase subunit 2